MSDPPQLAVVGVAGVLRDVVAETLRTNGFAVAAVEDAGLALIVLIDPTERDQVWSLELSVPSIVITSTTDDNHALRLFQRGAYGVVGAGAGPSDVVAAAGAVVAGGAWIPPGVDRLLLEHLRNSPEADIPALTRREADVIGCIDAGMSVKQTARALGIAPKTVENIQSRLFRKLGVRNRAQAVAVAHAAGLLVLDTPGGVHPQGSNPPG